MSMSSTCRAIAFEILQGYSWEHPFIVFKPQFFEFATSPIFVEDHAKAPMGKVRIPSCQDWVDKIQCSEFWIHLIE